MAIPMAAAAYFVEAYSDACWEREPGVAAATAIADAFTEARTGPERSACEHVCTNCSIVLP